MSRLKTKQRQLPTYYLANPNSTTKTQCQLTLMLGLFSCNRLAQIDSVYSQIAALQLVASPIRVVNYQLLRESNKLTFQSYRLDLNWNLTMSNLPKNTSNTGVKVSKTAFEVQSELREKWLTALESDEWHQATGSLWARKGENKEDTCYCCLGVAMEMCDPDDQLMNKSLSGVTISSAGKPQTVSAGGVVSDKVREMFGFHDDGGSLEDVATDAYVQWVDHNGDEISESLAVMNDEGATFKEIATFVRNNMALVFQENTDGSDSTNNP